MVNRADADQTGYVHHNVTKGVARITIDQPEKRNALGLQTIAALTALFRQFDDDPTVRAIVLTGAGNRVFASGADLDELPLAFDTPEAAKNYDSQVTPLYEAMAACRKPTIARVGGHAIGGGFLLALACDVRIATDDIKIGFPVALIGLMLSPYEYGLVLRHTSLSAAKFLMFTGRRISAHEAKLLGLLDMVVSADIFDDVVGNIANQIVAGAPRAISASKSILNALKFDASIEAVINKAYESVYTSSDLKEGLAAIRAKRRPTFTGN